MSTKPRVNPQRASLVRHLRKTGFAEKSIYRWLNSGTGPRSQFDRVAWDKALAKARATLPKAG